MRTFADLMRTDSDRNKTYTQTEAAKLCGITQRALQNRQNKQGYLAKLFYCFPGEHWEMVTVGSLEEPSKIRLTSRGVEELKELIQNLSPEPPKLDENREPIREHGAVVKVRLSCPRYTLEEYAESVWFLNQIDGKAEHERINQEKARENPKEKIQEETIEAELVESGEMVSVHHSSGSAIEQVFEALESMDLSFWDELERRGREGKLQGRLLKAVELQSRVEGELELETEYVKRAKKIADKRKIAS